MTVRSLSLPEELEVKLEEALAAWHARKVQVLIDDDDLPENAMNVLPLERLEEALQELPVPTKVYVSGRVYKVKLRKKVSYEEYQRIKEKLGELSDVWWDRKEQVLKVLRYQEAPEESEEEELEVEEIVIQPEEVGT
ncbi:hypothetical protein E3E23_00530 [Thermococcus sp. CX2]|uniref:hypothetical protein n=1 Tax=Thermococcus sp. CX2 TaxID=163006 RepID=UPI001438E605|nr:hypothetical protein [Thermococcus sp. CX2]NJE84333.1 hypothetical protein [Thermococcus sp. CX2]